MSGRMRMVKWVRLYHSKKYNPPTAKQLEKRKIKEQILIESLSYYFEDDAWLYKSSLDIK